VGGLDPAKIFVVLIIALIVLGPERLPGAARQLGGAWRELNKLREKFEDEVRSAVPDLDISKIPTSPSKAVTGYLSGLVSGLSDTSATSAGAATTSASGSVAESIEDAPRLRTPAGGSVTWREDSYREDSRSSWRPLLGSEHTAGYRQAPSVPSPSGGSLPDDSVFMLDEPSMN